MTGNCLNNNTKVYCVILGNTIVYNAKSSSVILKVQGNSIYSSCFEFISFFLMSKYTYIKLSQIRSCHRF